MIDKVKNIYLNCKSNLNNELMESYISIAKVEVKNKNILKNLKNVQISYDKLLDYTHSQEIKFNEFLDFLKTQFSNEKENLIQNSEIEKTKLINEFNQKLINKEEQLKKEKTSNEVIDSKNIEIVKQQKLISDLNEEIK